MVNKLCVMSKNLISGNLTANASGLYSHIKLVKDLLLQNQWADCNETWYVAFGISVHHSMYYDIGLNLTYFTPRSNLVTEVFAMKKVKINYFSETIAGYDLKGS